MNLEETNIELAQHRAQSRRSNTVRAAELHLSSAPLSCFRAQHALAAREPQAIRWSATLRVSVIGYSFTAPRLSLRVSSPHPKTFSICSLILYLVLHATQPR